MNILSEINWIDIFVIILLFRICYVSFKNGLTAEVFKTLGIFSAVYLAFHYYHPLAALLETRLTKEGFSLRLPSFLVLALGGYLVFIFLRIVFSRFIKMEAAPDLNKVGGLVLGVIRGLLLASLVCFTLSLSGLGYFISSVRGSYLGRQVLKIAPDAYSWFWHNAASKFMTEERFNQDIFEVEKEVMP